MRNLTIVALAFFGVWYAMEVPTAQLPVPTALLEHRVVFLTGQNLERGWLNWAAAAAGAPGSSEAVSASAKASVAVFSSVNFASITT